MRKLNNKGAFLGVLESAYIIGVCLTVFTSFVKGDYTPITFEAKAFTEDTITNPAPPEVAYGSNNFAN